LTSVFVFLTPGAARLSFWPNKAEKGC